MISISDPPNSHAVSRFDIFVWGLHQTFPSHPTRNLAAGTWKYTFLEKEKRINRIHPFLGWKCKFFRGWSSNLPSSLSKTLEPQGSSFTVAGMPKGSSFRGGEIWLSQAGQPGGSHIYFMVRNGWVRNLNVDTKQKSEKNAIVGRNPPFPNHYFRVNMLVFGGVLNNDWLSKSVSPNQ